MTPVRYEVIPIKRVIISGRRRPTGDIAELADSIRDLGLLNPITVTPDKHLVAGGRRLAACKSLGWETIPVTIMRFDRIQAEMAEIDENLIRKELSALEYDEQMARRKTLHEALHPGAKRGGDRKSQRAKSKRQDVGLISFAEETAAKIGASTRTVERAVRRATAIPEPIRDRIRETPLADNRADLMKLARLRPEKQAAVVEAILATPTLTVPQAERVVARADKDSEMEAEAAEAKAARGDAPLSWSIVDGDCVEQLAEIEAGSVRLLFADPPYNIGIDYGQGKKADRRPQSEYLDECRRWMRAAVRTLTPDGSMWVLINEDWADHFGLMLSEAGLHRRRWIIWFESFGNNCTSKDNFSLTSRHLFHMVKDPKHFVFHFDAVRRPSDRLVKYADKRADPDGKDWGSVWGIDPPIPRVVGTSKERIRDFPTQLPLALLRPIIGCASDPGDLVLDPFSGSGTTGAACIKLGRRYVGIEKNPEFARLSRLRLDGTRPVDQIEAEEPDWDARWEATDAAIRHEFDSWDPDVRGVFAIRLTAMSRLLIGLCPNVVDRSGESLE